MKANKYHFSWSGSLTCWSGFSQGKRAFLTLKDAEKLDGNDADADADVVVVVVEAWISPFSVLQSLEET